MGRPVLSWMVDNIHVCTDPADNIKSGKQKPPGQLTASSLRSWRSTGQSEAVDKWAVVCMTGEGYSCSRGAVCGWPQRVS
ncbi:hypothetical protein SAMN05660282_01711 [Corynebacterium spheniscorum]|uniref:Uncharacterized protein n=1 Tax=Corynebacterium spheniscorum TaxID=185761 RepID=A0A1I2U2F3_9CORY|nr:hypothetical protein SAMN05660282_01711 [Corynebacterium spheniscorum]